MTPATAPHRRRGMPLLAGLVALTLVATACTPGAPGTPGADGDPTGAPPLDAATIEAVAADLPEDPIAAAERLVAGILAPDVSQATAATAELLRRAGHPIVSADGPVIAMPDEVGLYDAPVYAELLPLLVEATRADDRYTLEQFAAILTGVGFTEEDATPAQLAATIGEWAKEPDDHAIFTTAAAGVRALAGARSQVFYAEVPSEEVFLDPLQTIILLGHATSRLAQVDGAAVSAEASAASEPVFIDWILGTQPAHAAHADAADAARPAPAGACGTLAALFASPPDPVGKAEADWKKGQIKNHLATRMLSEGQKATFDKANEAWGKAGATASAILLLLATRLDLTADKSRTHFKHAAGSRDEHITLTATALFDPGIALKKLECYQLAGLDVPPPGPLKGMTVRWDSDQPQVGTTQKGGAQLLQTVSADSEKFRRGSKTGADGTATLELKPPVEDSPGEGPDLTGVAVFEASLDKENFPFELSDLVPFLTDTVGFAVGKTFDLVRDVLVKAGLPSQTIALQVDYHGADIIVAQGENSVWLFLATIPRVYVDLVSCKGVRGPFTGTAGYSGVESTEWLQMAGAATGVPVPKEFAGQDAQVSVMTAAARRAVPGGDERRVRLRCATGGHPPGRRRRLLLRRVGERGCRPRRPPEP